MEVGYVTVPVIHLLKYLPTMVHMIRNQNYRAGGGGGALVGE